MDRPNAGLEDTSNYIASVGLRVRGMRERKGISRRQLSEISGVSQRYLAQLETGAGNITIALLRSVAKAVGCSAAELAAESTGPDAAISDLLHHYRNASDEQNFDCCRCYNPTQTDQIAPLGWRS